MKRPLNNNAFYTNRELEIVKLLAHGNTSRQIAELLEISHDTVRAHRRNILNKSGVSTTVELIFKVAKERII